jgi:hypothetical protein
MATTITGSGVDKVIDGSITSTKIADGTITNADINASAAIAGSKVDGSFGKVLQVQQGILTGPFASTTATTWLDVVTVDITPSSTSSKIYVSFNLNAMVISNNQRAGCRMARDSTGIGVATSVGSRTASSVSFTGLTGHELQQKNMSNSILDTPSTTSQITYRLQVHCENTTEIKVNVDDGDGNSSSYYRSASTITVMEIGA